MLNLQHWFCVFLDPFFGRRNNNPAFNLKIVLNIFWKLCLELSFFIKIGRIFKFYCMILLVGYWILNVFKSWWYLDFLTAHAWVSGPDLAPQKILLSQQFRHLIRCKNILKKFFFQDCLNCWDNKNFWGAKSGPLTHSSAVKSVTTCVGYALEEQFLLYIHR